MAVFRCGGRFRPDDHDLDKPACTYQAETPWRGRCPGCRGPYSCDRIGAERSKRKLSTAAAAQSLEDVKHTPSGIEGFDDLLKGGIAPSQVILLAGQPGTRKTSLSLTVLHGLTKQTTRPLLLASAEQNDNDLGMFCKMLGVTSDQVKLKGNVADLDDVLILCDEIKPMAMVLDSMQAVSNNCGKSNELIGKAIVDYCKRTKMTTIIISHMTKNFDVKGGTGAPHYVDTILAFEPFIPELDGDPIEMFGRQALRDIGIDYSPINAGEKIENLRLLKSVMKNRYGSVGAMSYFFTTPEGGLAQLKKKTKIIPFGRVD